MSLHQISRLNEHDHPHLQLHGRIIQELGYEVSRHSKILDFGCGAGRRVAELRALGFEAFGVDIKLEQESPFLRLILARNPYRIPFDDHTFDFVYSDQVFEHVQDYDAALAEICRVLKPGGVSLHLFPPRYRPLEAHTFVPLGGVIQRRGWLRFWALLGVRNGFQTGLPSGVVADRNYGYLRESTCYLTKARIRRFARNHFQKVTFGEGYFIKHSYGRARWLYPLTRICPPVVTSLFSALHQRVLFLVKQNDAS